MQWYWYRIIDPIFDIVEVELWLTFVAKNQNLLKKKRIFSLIHIIRGAYVVLAIAALV